MARPDSDALPVPDAAARAHSARVVDAVVRAIDAAGGFLTLERYLALVLYAPGLGYYASGTQKLGAGGDFVTAPELTPLFGATVASQVAAILSKVQDGEVLELGAGSGALAAQMLDALAEQGVLPARYAILEVSPDLRARQARMLARHAPRVAWLDSLPARVEGAVIMNEVLDAVPPHVVVRRDGAWLERGVVHAGGRLALDERPLLDAALIARAAARFPPDMDYASEVNPAAEALVEDLGRRLGAGALLAIDYGFPRSEYYHPQRAHGTLMGHYRHRSHGDPLLWPGLTDLTAHVDFTAMAEAGERAGLAVAGFASQAAFLLGCGILDRLARVGLAQDVAYVRAATAVQQLTSPAEMGELFKVLALARSEGIDWRGFRLADRSHRL